MLRIRMVELEIARRYPEGKMRCPCHLSIGSEALYVGVMAALDPEDVIFCHHRCHAAYLAKGGDLKRMIAELYGKSAGCCGGRGGSQHLIDPSCGVMGTSAIVGGCIPMAVGMAEAFKRDGSRRRVVAFSGESVLTQGTIYECDNYMRLNNLPVHVIVELNGLQTNTKASEIVALGVHFPLLSEFSFDPVYISNETSGIINHAHTLIAMKHTTFRGCEHCGPKLVPIPDDMDPLKVCRPWVMQMDIDDWEVDIANEIDAAFDFAERSE